MLVRQHFHKLKSKSSTGEHGGGSRGHGALCKVIVQRRAPCRFTFTHKIARMQITEFCQAVLRNPSAFIKFYSLQPLHYTPTPLGF